MRFTTDAPAFAEAVAFAARAVSVRPVYPVLAGLKIQATSSGVEVAGFDYEVSARAGVAATVTETGTVLLPGRLLAAVTAQLPDRPVEVTAEDAKVSLVCGPSRFTLLTLPIADYPTLPQIPESVGAVEAEVFAAAVRQTAVAAATDELATPALCTVRLEAGPETLELTATDRYRAVWRTVPWTPITGAASPPPVTIPARVLSEATKQLTDGPINLAVARADDGSPTLAALECHQRQLTCRLLADPAPDVRKFFDAEAVATARLQVEEFTEAVKRIAVVTDNHAPALRLDFSDGQVVLAAEGREEASGTETVAVDYTAAPRTVAFNPRYLLDALTTAAAATAELAFTSHEAGKPALLHPADHDTAHRHLVMPIRTTSPEDGT